jgi:hypothetical protein
MAYSREVQLYLYMVIMLVSGTLLSIIVRYQNVTLGYQDKPFSHPFWQSFIAQFSQLGGFLFYWW